MTEGVSERPGAAFWGRQVTVTKAAVPIESHMM